jgi:WD40 repeat protein
LSPDGTRLATGGEDGVLYLWDAQTGAALATGAGHTRAIHDIRYSPDGKWIVTAGEDQTARIWDGSSGKCARVLEGHGQPVDAAEFACDNVRVLTTCQYGSVYLWHWPDGRNLFAWRGTWLDYSRARFSPRGDAVLFASIDGRVWDASTGAVRHTLQAPDGQSAVLELVPSPDGGSYLGRTEGGNVCIWNARTGKLVTQLRTKGRRVMVAFYSPDGRRILTGGTGDTATLWHARTGALLATFSAGRAAITPAAFSPAGDTFLATGKDGTIRLYPATLPGLLTLAEQCLRYQPEYEKVRPYFEGGRDWLLRPEGQLREPEELQAGAVHLLPRLALLALSATFALAVALLRAHALRPNRSSRPSVRHWLRDHFQEFARRLSKRDGAQDAA